MTRRRFFQIAATLPLVVPLIALGILATVEGAPRGTAGPWLGILSLTLLFAGPVYLVCAGIWLWLQLARDLDLTFGFSWLAPLAFVPPFAAAWIVLSLVWGQALEVALGHAAFLSACALVVGYGYVGLTHLLYALARLLGAVRQHAPAGAALAALLVACVLVACAPLSQVELERQLERAGASVRGLGRDFVVVPIHADSQIAAWTLLAEARTEGGSQLAERLGHDFARAERRTMKIVVGGTYPALTHEVVMEALEQNAGADLSRLTLVVVGSGEYADELRAAARARRARFYQRDLP